MTEDQTTENMIQEKGLNAPRIRPEQINALMERIIPTYFRHGTSTFCHGFLNGDFYLGTGHSACVSPENFNAEIGFRIAFKEMIAVATKKLWELEGYHLYKTLKETPND